MALVKQKAVEIRMRLNRMRLGELLQKSES